MTFKIAEWDNDTQQMIIRDSTPEEDAAAAAVSAPIIPQSVTRRQGRQALLLGGYLDKVQPVIDAMTDATQKGLTQIWWDDAETFDRNNPATIQLGAAIGLDSAGLDNLFIQASTL